MDESGVSSGDEMIDLQDSHDLFASDTDDPMEAELSDCNEDDNTSAVSGGDTSAVFTQPGDHLLAEPCTA